MLPNFIHIGAAKCASSWLWCVYQEHPDVYVPVHLDNVNFFVADYHKGLDWYERTYFGEWDGEKAVGETSNSYMVIERALERIARDLPGVKLTMTLRDPIERAFLQWVHFSKRNLKPDNHMTFEDGLKAWGLFRMWLEPGLYASHLKKVYRHFPVERVLVNFYDDLVADPGAFIRRFFEFLEVDPDFEPTILHTVIGFPSPEQPDTENGALKRGFPDAYREELRKMFREETEKLAEMTGRDLEEWK